MSTHFQTESGAHYEIEPGRVRRIEGHDGNTKRRDGDWLHLVTMFPKTPKVGHGVVLVLESLAADGPDDYGTVDPGPVTTRHTTPVERVWEES